MEEIGYLRLCTVSRSLEGIVFLISVKCTTFLAHLLFVLGQHRYISCIFLTTQGVNHNLHFLT